MVARRGSGQHSGVVRHDAALIAEPLAGTSGSGPTEPITRSSRRRSRDLPATKWGVRRRTRADQGAAARVVKTFEDAPFLQPLAARRVLARRVVPDHPRESGFGSISRALGAVSAAPFACRAGFSNAFAEPDRGARAVRTNRPATRRDLRRAASAPARVATPAAPAANRGWPAPTPPGMPLPRAGRRSQYARRGSPATSASARMRALRRQGTTARCVTESNCRRATSWPISA